MYNKLKNKKVEKVRGITLIALVITIIVLLILAGVSIAMLTRSKWIVIAGKWSKNRNRRNRNKRESRIRSNSEVMMKVEYSRWKN